MFFQVWSLELQATEFHRRREPPPPEASEKNISWFNFYFYLIWNPTGTFSKRDKNASKTSGFGAFWCFLGITKKQKVDPNFILKRNINVFWCFLWAKKKEDQQSFGTRQVPKECLFVPLWIVWVEQNTFHSDDGQSGTKFVPLVRAEQNLFRSDDSSARKIAQISWKNYIFISWK